MYAKVLFRLAPSNHTQPVTSFKEKIPLLHPKKFHYICIRLLLHFTAFVLMTFILFRFSAHFPAFRPYQNIESSFSIQVICRSSDLPKGHHANHQTCSGFIHTPRHVPQNTNCKPPCDCLSLLILSSETPVATAT